MNIKLLTFLTILLPLLLALTSCGGTDGSDRACDQEMLDFFGMEPSDGIDIGCELHLVKLVQGNLLTGTSVQYYLSSHCADMVIAPFDCDMEEVTTDWLADNTFSEEIIGVRL